MQASYLKKSAVLLL